MQAITFQAALRLDSQKVVHVRWHGYSFGVPGLVASPAIESDDGKPKRRYRLWTLVHLPSGFRIGPVFSSRALAVAAGRVLGKLAPDWSYSAEAILGNVDLVEAAGRILYGGVEL